jgi:ABC-type nitrate/sulfonate/bicarbonate transport system permease component
MKVQTESSPAKATLTVWAPRRHWNLWRDSKLGGVGLILLLLLLWELSARTQLIALVSWPSVSTILATWVELVLNGQLPAALLPSFGRLAVGYVLAVVTAVPIGLAMGYSRVTFNLLEPLSESLRPIPSSALVPILILFLGIENEMKIALISYASFFPILLNTYSGVRDVDPILINTGRTLGLKPWRILAKIIIPSASPYILTGMRISLAVSLILTVISEMVAGSDGIGYFTLRAQRSFMVPQVYAAILTLGMVGYGLNTLFVALERRLMRWHIGHSRQVI